MAERERSRSEVNEYEQLFIDFDKGGTDQYSSPLLTYGGSESMTDHETPHFHRRMARGEIINNPCLYQKLKHYQIGSGYVTCDNGGSIKYHLIGPVTAYRSNEGALIDYSDLEPAFPDIEAKAKLYALSRVDSTPFAFGEDVLELRETARFLRNPVSSILDLSKTFKKEVKKTFRNRRFKTDSIANLAEAHAKVWLQYRFAFSPLIRSSMDALEAFSSKTKTLPPRLTARGFASDTHDASGTQIYSGWAYFDRTVKTSQNIKASILYEVTNPIYDWKYKLGFRVKDWPTTIWQIMPYSFMVDRLYNISAFSKAVINLADPNVKILAASTTEKYEDIRSYSFVNHVQSGWTFTFSSTDVCFDETFKYHRKTWSPSITDAIPKATPKGLIDDATKITDLVSLIIANLR